MSDQSKSNLQAIGAGLLGFAAVLLVGVGALFLHSKLTAQTAALPVPAAAPIDLGSSMPRPGSVTPAERRENSPAPIIGRDEDGAQAAPSEARAGSPSSPAARAAAARAAEGARSAPALKASEHLTAEASTTAEAKVEEAPAKPEKAAKIKHLKASANAPAALAAGDGAAGGDAAVASVHYGVKSRSELMGRAAGPVYNFNGGGKKGGTTAGAGKVAGASGIDPATLADLKKQLQNANLPTEQRAAILKQLEGTESSEGGVEDAPR